MDDPYRWGRALLVAGADSVYPPKFSDWLESNKAVWDGFAKQALMLRDRGWKHYSATAILYYLRHHTNISEAPAAPVAVLDGRSGDFKVNAFVSPYIARAFCAVFPRTEGLFEFRAVAADRRLPGGKGDYYYYPGEE